MFNIWTGSGSIRNEAHERDRCTYNADTFIQNEIQRAHIHRVCIATDSHIRWDKFKVFHYNDEIVKRLKHMYTHWRWKRCNNVAKEERAQCVHLNLEMARPQYIHNYFSYSLFSYCLLLMLFFFHFLQSNVRNAHAHYTHITCAVRVQSSNSNRKQIRRMIAMCSNWKMWHENNNKMASMQYNVVAVALCLGSLSFTHSLSLSPGVHRHRTLDANFIASQIYKCIRRVAGWNDCYVRQMQLNQRKLETHTHADERERTKRSHQFAMEDVLSHSKFEL